MAKKDTEASVQDATAPSEETNVDATNPSPPQSPIKIDPNKNPFWMQANAGGPDGTDEHCCLIEWAETPEEALEQGNAMMEQNGFTLRFNQATPLVQGGSFIYLNRRNR